MFKIVLACSLLLLSVASLGGAQGRSAASQPSAGFTISGQILTDSTRSEGRRPVNLERDGSRIDTAYTDTLGRFEFRGLPPGDYEVVVIAEGYDDARHRVDFLPNTRGAVVLIPLRRKAPPDNPSERLGTVDVTELDRNIPRKAVEELEKGEEESRKGNTNKAVERLQAALKVAPDFYRARIALGRVYQGMKRHSEAELEFKAARTLNPRTAQPILNLADLYIQQASAQESPAVAASLIERALGVSEEALRLEPGSAMAHYLFGTAAYRSTRYELAEAHLHRALELDAQMGAARLMLANLYGRLENWDAALTQLDAYLAENPNAANRSQVEQIRAKVEANRRSPPPLP